MGCILDNAQRLDQIAAAQGGYFIAFQAKQAGYVGNHHHYHCQTGNWEQVDRGLYRLPVISPTPESALWRWLLWSANRLGQIQAALSHETALAWHGLIPAYPQKIQLILPPDWRRPAPTESILVYKRSLSETDLDPAAAVRVTTIRRTLTDCRDAGLAEPLLRQAAENAVGLGRLTRDEIDQLKLFGRAVPAGAPETDPVRRAARFGRIRRRVPAARSDWSAQTAVAEDSGRLSQAAGGPGTGRGGMTPSRDPLVRRRPGEAAFALVELLVVVALVSGLGGVILPATQRALRNSQQALCAEHEKRLAAAFQVYADDYAGYFPAPFDSVRYGGNYEEYPEWFITLGPYADCPWGRGYYPAGRKTGTAFNCPAASARTPGMAVYPDGTVWGLAMNRRIPPGEAQADWQHELSCYPQRGLIAAPAEKLLLADSRGGIGSLNAYWEFTQKNPGAYYCLDHVRHSGGANLLYCDGHVVWRAQAEIFRQVEAQTLF